MHSLHKRQVSDVVSSARAALLSTRACRRYTPMRGCRLSDRETQLAADQASVQRLQAELQSQREQVGGP